MNNKKLKDLIEQLKEVTEELRSAETLGAEEKEEEKKAVIEAAEVSSEVCVMQETEKVNVAEKAAQTAEMTVATASATNPTEEMHCYKDFELPDNITVRTDLLKKKTEVTIGYFGNEKSFIGYKPMHVYQKNKGSGSYGNSFRLNISENVTDCVNVTHILDNSDYMDSSFNLCKKFDDYYVAGMVLLDHAPVIAQNLSAYNELKSLTDTDRIMNYTFSWLYNGVTAKGYNYMGNLVFVCDNNKNYAKITYDTNSKITKLVEGSDYFSKKKKTYNFTYDSSNHLSMIKSVSSGKSVLFGYNGNNLTEITKFDGKILTISIDSNLLSVSSADGYLHKISNSDTEVNVTTQSTLSRIPSEIAAINPAMLSQKITFGDTVKIEYKDGDNEYYKFKENGDTVMLSEYYRENCSVVTYAEKRTYTFNTNNNKYTLKTYIAPKSLLYRTPYSSFVYRDVYGSEYKDCTFDEYNRPTYETTGNHIVDSDGTYDNYLNYSKTNTYDGNGLLTKESIRYSLYSIHIVEGNTEGESSCEQIVEYEYYTDNRLKKRTSYYTDRVTTKGKDIEEYIYENGDSTYKITVLKYNSLAPSKVFVNETVYGGYGNVISQTDATGLKKMKYAWDKNDNLQSVTMPDGCFTDYMLDAEFETAIVTATTLSGDENNNIMVYSNGELMSASSPQNSFSFGYDGQRRLSYVKADNVELYKLTYDDISDKTTVTAHNANGGYSMCVSDKSNTWTNVNYDGFTQIYTKYKDRHLIETEKDEVSSETAKYTYGKTENVSKYEVTENDTTTYSALFEYNSEGRILRIHQSGRTGIPYEYAYDEMYDGRLLSVKAGEERFYVNYDVLGRYTGRQIKYGSYAREVLTETISYKQEYASVPTSSGSRNAYKQSILPSKMSYSDGEYLDYSYDLNGNITGISKNGSNRCVYEYDNLGRLTYEYNPLLNETYYYSYDSNGNILSKKVISGSNGETKITNYQYNKGKLIKDEKGHFITYDSLGNPTIYRGKDLTWEKGKRLKKFGETTFEYDGRGRRTKKNTVRYYYNYADKLIASSDGMEYFYDHIGVAGFKKDGAWYVYKRDIQNNITGILDSNGTEVVKYVYDAWGNHTVSGSKASTLGALNPFRYRSYFYDTETGLYFLKSRYYDPYIGRFLNMDSVDYAEPGVINGLNLYAYCGNNPVMNVDPEGTGFFTILLTAMVMGLVFGGAHAALTAAQGGSAKECLAAFANTFVQSTILSAVSMVGGALVVGGMTATLANIIGTVGLTTVGTFGGGIAAYYIEHFITGEKTSFQDALKNGALMFTQGIFSFGIGAALGASGLYNWLKPGNGIFSVINSGKDFFISETGKFGAKGIFYGIANYLGANIGAMAINTFIRNIFIFPWNLIKP